MGIPADLLYVAVGPCCCTGPGRRALELVCSALVQVLCWQSASEKWGFFPCCFMPTIIILSGQCLPSDLQVQLHLFALLFLRVEIRHDLVQGKHTAFE